MLETKRTILRNFKDNDLAALFAYTKLEGVGEAAGWKHHETLTEAQTALNTFCKNENTLAIVLKETNQVIGHITAHDDSVDQDPKVKELGFVLHPDYQNQGIMTEVVLSVLADLFTNGIKTIYACCFEENQKSKRLIEKCGFSFDQKGSFESASLNKTFVSDEFVMTQAAWKETIANN